MYSLALNRLSVPRIELTYLACRIAFLETQERIVLARQFPETPQEGFGYLTEVPFLREVSPEVQLDLLARAWERCSTDNTPPFSMLEESILFAACERAVWCLGCEESDVIERHLGSGPVSLAGRSRNEWQTLLQMYQFDVSPMADFLLLDELADLSPEEAECARTDWGISREQTDPMFDVLSEWRSSPGMHDRLAGLLTPGEIETVRELSHH
ncbi:MAG TPA: hypothetical protein VLA12_11735 [Planctomycetaceae bacterium]|nr:hypothetical protein [Planctomycetaceae bacterium]